MPSNPLTDKEIFDLSIKNNLPNQRFFATNPNIPSKMGYYDIDAYLTGLGYIKSTPPVTSTWIGLVTGYKAGTEPTLNTTLPGGEVYDYIYEGTPDITYYRYIANDGSIDAFYETFTLGVLSNLIVQKEITI